jgi:hypothetical protein
VHPLDSLLLHPTVSTVYALVSTGTTRRDTAAIAVSVTPIDQFDRALNRPVSVTGRSSIGGLADSTKIVDGDTTSLWVSASRDTQAVTIDLGQTVIIQKVRIFWGNNYAEKYLLQSSGGFRYSPFASDTSGGGGTEVFDSLNGVGRYFQLYMNNRHLKTTGFILREVQVFGVLQPVSAIGGVQDLPGQFALFQNYPNPFNPTTTIRFALPVRSRVAITIYSILGQEVASLVNGTMDAGYHFVHWTASVASGVYFCRMEASPDGGEGRAYQQTLKLMVLK